MLAQSFPDVLGFRLPPFHRRIERAVKKEKKFYFFPWTLTREAGAGCENYMAVQLYTACRYWRDQGLGTFELAYLRDQDRREIDYASVMKNGAAHRRHCLPTSLVSD